MSAGSNWVVTFDPFGGTITAIGPVDSQAEAAALGRRWQQANNDSPCWNTVTGTPNLRFAKPSEVVA